ncbi:MAG: diguanylate cyclase [Phycisphaerales bacterium]|nr:diguanylate cyclase [Phycisphaerales bacterium]
MTLRRIILIDDSEAVHRLVRARLAGEPVEIRAARDGQTGMALIREWPPDLILLDAELPSGNAADFCRALRSDPATLHIPVLLLVGAAALGQKPVGLEAGVFDFVAKPLDSTELRARVRAGLRMKFLMELLQKKARIDSLTGLWNREFLQQRLQEEQSLAQRTGRPLACILIDLKGLDAINQRCGYAWGDQALRAVADCIQRHTRSEDILCRVGGDEFALLLPNTSQSGANALAKRLLESVSHLTLNGPEGVIRLGATVGVGAVDSATGSSPVEAAIQALLRSKADPRRNAVAQCA